MLLTTDKSVFLKTFWRTLTMGVCVLSVSDRIGILTLFLLFRVRKSLFT